MSLAFARALRGTYAPWLWAGGYLLLLAAAWPKLGLSLLPLSLLPIGLANVQRGAWVGALMGAAFGLFHVLLAAKSHLSPEGWAWVGSTALAGLWVGGRGRPALASGTSQSLHDELTGLPTAALFEDRLAHALMRTRRERSRRFAVMCVSADGLEAAWRRLGRSAGDVLLRAVGHRLEGSVRPGDTVTRLGSEQFAVLLEDTQEGKDALAAGERVRRALLTPLPMEGGEALARARVGLALADETIHEPGELVRRAREAADYARDQAVLFERRHDRAQGTPSMENALRSAIAQGQIAVHYQPVVDLARGVITGFEALARWRHPTLGLIAPMSFIPLAEQSGLIHELGSWILCESLAQARKWQGLGPAGQAPRINVNLSARQLRDDQELVQRVAQALKQSGFAPSALTLEVNESLVLQDDERGVRLLSELRDRGVHVCMDEFGTGYSSLSYLHRARVDALKIDVSFVRDLTEDTEHAEIVRSILTLAKALGLRAIAEGVETQAQLARLRELGCDDAQGFLFSPPVDAETAEMLLKSPIRW